MIQTNKGMVDTGENYFESFHQTPHGELKNTYYNPFVVKHRKRTSKSQLKVLEKTFETNIRPDANLRKTLAEQLGMTSRSVQVWFQNRRAKIKKSTKTKSKSQQENEPNMNLMPKKIACMSDKFEIMPEYEQINKQSFKDLRNPFELYPQNNTIAYSPLSPGRMCDPYFNEHMNKGRKYYTDSNKMMGDYFHNVYERKAYNNTDHKTISWSNVDNKMLDEQYFDTNIGPYEQNNFFIE